jgi:lipopolysaccharide transport system permease protein
VLLLLLGMMGMGCGILISSLTTKYRDLSVLVGFGMGLWMYATPVVYPMSQLGDGILKTLIQLNPVTAPVELFRYAVLGVGTVNMTSMIISVLFTSIVLFLGIVVFNRVERTFMDTV